MAKLNPGTFEKHTPGDGRRFHVRIHGTGFQVYGRGLEHICFCGNSEMAAMIADSLECVGLTYDKLESGKQNADR